LLSSARIYVVCRVVQTSIPSSLNAFSILSNLMTLAFWQFRKALTSSG
jgi:hypothetical protein